MRRWTLCPVVVGMVWLTASCAPSAATPDTLVAASIPVAPATPLDRTRISPLEREAIESLGRSQAGVPHSGHDHGHVDTGDQPDYPLLNGDAIVFADQWLQAQAAVPSYDTPQKAAALGYVRASTPSAGVGTHWVLWSQVAKAFDPAHPSMLLFDERRQPAVLVGFAYLLQSSEEPVGFAGGNDQWHQHTGLCVVNGWVDREEATGPSACAGSYLAGGDLWMLHAWVVPSYPNRNGRFANTNRSLCPSKYGTPDILRCPGD